MNIEDKSVVSKIINDIEASETRLRRELEYKSYKVSEGAQSEYVQEELIKLFPKSWSTMRQSDISISKKILDKVAAYTNPPIRELDNEEKTEELHDIYNVGNFDAAFREFDRDYNRQKYALLWVNKINEKFMLMPLKGFESFVVLNQNTGDLECVVLNYPDTSITDTNGDGLSQIIAETQDDSGADSKVYALWTKDQHVIYTVKKNNTIGGVQVDINLVPNPENPTNVNPLGVIPFVWVSKSTAFDLPFLNNITSQSITANVLMSDLLTAASNQGHGQLVLKMPTDIKIEKLHTGQATAINLPLLEDREQQPSAEYINANPDLTGMSETVYQYIASILDEHGLSSSSLKGDDKSFSSGIERLIAQADTHKIVSLNQSTYTQVEKDVFEIIKAYDAVEGITRFKDEDLTVIFEKPRVLISDSETLANIEKRMQLGLITKKEALQMLDPNLGEAGAEAKLLDINTEKSEMVANVFGNGRDNEEN